MESKFFYLEGQTPENTKIADRNHALHITEQNWNRVVGHLDRRRLIREQIEKEEAKKKALKDGSEEMTRQWENSVENIRRRKEEERLKKIKDMEDNKFRGFYNLRVEQEEKRKKFIAETNAKMFASAGYPRQINFALLECEVWKERENQVEFNKMIKEQEKMDYMEMGKILLARDMQVKKEDEEKARVKMEAMKTNAEECRKFMEGKAEEREKERLERHRREEEINIAARKELQEIEEIQKQEKIRSRKNIKEMLQKDRIQKAMEAKRREEEQQEMDEVIKIYSEAKWRMECMKKRKENELLELLKNRNKLAIENLTKIKAEISDEFMTKWVNNKVDWFDREEANRIKEEESRKQRIEDYQKWKLQDNERKRLEDEVTKWEVLNRLKTDEVMKEFDAKCKGKDKDTVLKYRQQLLDQIKEDEEKRKKEKDEQFCKFTYENWDKQFFDYAEETRNIAKEKGLITFPIDKVVKAYIKENCLEHKQNNTTNENHQTKGKKNRPCKCCKMPKNSKNKS